jgi:hypothetical protein
MGAGISLPMSQLMSQAVGQMVFQSSLTSLSFAGAPVAV